MNSLYRLALFISIAAIFASGLAYAGKLDDFEKDTSKKQENKTNDSGKKQGKKSNDKSFCSEIFDEIFWMVTAAVVGGIVHGIVEGGKESYKREKGQETAEASENESDRDKDEGKGHYSRVPGDLLIPYARVDASFQYLNKDLNAQDYLAEFGYGPAAIQGRFTHYMERDPDDSMDAAEIYLLYRMSFGKMVEVDLGAGGMLISGEKTHSGISIVVPVKIKPTKNLGLELRPAFGTINENFMQDYDVCLFFGGRYASARAGYRWYMSPNESLDGPYIGVSLYY